MTMCKVTHIKQQKYFHHLKRRGYNTQTLLYPRPLMKIFLLFYMCHLLWIIHIVTKHHFFYIYICSFSTKLNL